MSITAFNVAGNSTSRVLRNFFNKNGDKFEKIFLMDKFQNYYSHRNAFQIAETNEEKNKFTYEKIFDKKMIMNNLKQSEYMLYFTHNLYMNVTCKNQLLKNVSELAKNCENLKSIVFVNNLELSHTKEKNKYFEDAKEIENWIVENVPNSKILWHDITTGSYTDFLNSSTSLPSSQTNKKFVNENKISQGIEKLLFEKKKGKFYLKPNLEYSPSEIRTILEKSESSGIINYGNENILTEYLSNSEYRNNYRLWVNTPDLNKVLNGYEELEFEGDFKEFDLMQKNLEELSLKERLMYI